MRKKQKEHLQNMQMLFFVLSGRMRGMPRLWKRFVRFFHGANFGAAV